jgi:hypothetical protein
MSEHQNARDEQAAPRSIEPVGMDVSADRRAILKKLGRFGAYTAPALLVMLESTKAAHASISKNPEIAAAVNEVCQCMLWSW